jgi:hypothetical protein
MPLLNICAISGANMVIQVAIVFLSGEKEADYNWATDFLRQLMAIHAIEEPTILVTDRELALIRSLNTRFPSTQHLLCRWHVNMNVTAKTKRFFPAPVRAENGSSQITHHPQFQEFLSSWNMLLASPTMDSYNIKLLEMRVKYPTGAMEYCEETWVIWKENLVACYINQYPHFGITVTSVIEGCHATLKRYLKRGHSDLKGVFD